jgi:RNA polymerase sigma factor (sigma-70 family)
MPDEVRAFEEFFERAEPRLREALSATLGSQDGHDAAAEVLSYAWEHWERVQAMENPVGYLYVRGRGRGRRAQQSRRRPTLLPVDNARPPWIEPELPTALALLPEQQRTVVMLLHCFQWTMSEVADVLHVSKSTVQTHAERGLALLRERIGVTL